MREFPQEMPLLLRPCEVGAAPEAELGGEVRRLERGWLSEKAPENRKVGKAQIQVTVPQGLSDGTKRQGRGLKHAAARLASPVPSLPVPFPGP